MGMVFVMTMGLCVLMMGGLLAINSGDRKLRGQMSPSDLRKFEVDPGPEPDGITTANVADVINSTIETGVEHPLLTARKARYNVTARKDADFDWPETMPCDCGGLLKLVSIEDGYVCDNELCVTNS